MFSKLEEFLKREFATIHALGQFPTATRLHRSMARHGYLHSVAHVLPPDTIPLLAALAEASAGPSGCSSFRASPLLHWCYATRASAVLRAVQTFLEDKEGDANRRVDKGGRPWERLVVVLGGGMDGLVLALCARAAQATGVGVKVVELDVPEVVARKEGVLWAWRGGGGEGVFRDFLRQTGSYRLEAVDLRDGGRVGEVVGEVVREGGGAGREGKAPPDGDGSKGGGQGEVEPQVLLIMEAVLGYMRVQEVKILLRYVHPLRSPPLFPRFPPRASFPSSLPTWTLRRGDVSLLSVHKAAFLISFPPSEFPSFIPLPSHPPSFPPSHPPSRL